MTMAEMKPIAIIEFNKYITDIFCKEYFADTFDLWSDAESYYNDTNNGYKVVIKRFVKPILAEIKKANVLLENAFTKRITQTMASNTAEESNQDKTNSSTQDLSVTETDGEFIQSQRRYPDGYNQAPDPVYTVGQVHDSTYTQTNVTDGSNTGTEAIQATKDITTGGTTETDEIDGLSLADKLDAYNGCFSMVERCVFEFVANKIDGVL